MLLAWILPLSVPQVALQPEPRSDDVGNCDLCARDFLFIFATGRSGSTSLLEALNSLPGINLRGENHASLWAAYDMYERSISPGPEETFIAAREHGNISTHRLLCTLQDFFVAMDPPAQNRQGEAVTVHGFKELVLPSSMAFSNRSLMREVNHDPDKLPSQPDGWFDFVQRLFPCSRIVFNYRKDTAAQANSAFFSRANVTSAELATTKGAMLAWHKRLQLANGNVNGTAAPRSFLVATEELAPKRVTQLAHWLGFPGCTFHTLPKANDPDSYDETDPQNVAGMPSTSHMDYQHVNLTCGEAGTATRPSVVARSATPARTRSERCLGPGGRPSGGRVILIKTHKTASGSIFSILGRTAIRRRLRVATPPNDENNQFGWPGSFPDGPELRRTNLPREEAHVHELENERYLAKGKPFDMLIHHANLAPAQMSAVAPDAPFVTIIRNPVDQFISAWDYFYAQASLTFPLLAPSVFPRPIAPFGVGPLLLTQDEHQLSAYNVKFDSSTGNLSSATVHLGGGLVLQMPINTWAERAAFAARIDELGVNAKLGARLVNPTALQLGWPLRLPNGTATRNVNRWIEALDDVLELVMLQVCTPGL